MAYAAAQSTPFMRIHPIMTASLSRRAAVTSLLAAAVSAVSAATFLTPARADTPGAGFPEKSSPRSRTGGLKGELTPGDREINTKCINKTLTEAPTGKTWSWSNPKTGNKGTVTPTTKAQRHAGQTCRDFKETITLKDGRTETLNSKACRNADGGWTISG